MLAAHADWSIASAKRWMCLARQGPTGWSLSMQPVGPVTTLFGRLLAEAGGGPVAFGADLPIGLPRAFAARHANGTGGFPAFLRGLADRPDFFQVAAELADVGPDRPFYPARGRRGMTRLSHALALGLDGAADLSRACDRATPLRPAGAPLFWTLGANQSGKAAISAWRDLLLPALSRSDPPLLWPFEGRFRDLLRPGRVAVAECYPAEALRQLGLRPVGSKRRQADRHGLVPGLRRAMAEAGAVPDAALEAWLGDGFGADAAGEDRLDCLLGLLCVLAVLGGRRPDTVPDDPWLARWEGWVLGQDAPAQSA